MHSSISLHRIVIAIAGAVLLSGCGLATADAPVLIANGTGQLPMSSYRFRADTLTPDVEQVVRSQYRQINALHEPKKSKRVANFLAISGGGGDGAFSAGFLNGWSAKGRPEFEVVTGVSTGALIAPFAFLGPAYDDHLRKLYTTIGDADVYTSLGPIGVLGQSLYDPGPLRTRIQSELTDGMLDEIAAQYARGRRLLIQTVDIETQIPYIWDVTQIAAKTGQKRQQIITDLLLASAAIPGLFPPVRVRVQRPDGIADELHVDGGLSAQIFFAPPGLDLAKFEIEYFGRPREQNLYLLRNGKLAGEDEAVQLNTLALTNRAISTLIKSQSRQNMDQIRSSLAEQGTQVYTAAIPDNFSSKPESMFDTAYMRELYRTGYSIGASKERWSSTHGTRSVVPARHTQR
ncbi:MAG: patatin-like phospholipase family protein [Hyphomicrobium sp.]|nr:patatin-like phospholipase family protein [Hyphomicrobium sp.]